MRSSVIQVAIGCSFVVLAGCASVTSQVTVFDPTRHYAPTQNVVILLRFPQRPHTNIGLIEAKGTVGGSESELLEVAREKARALGADALVRLDVTSVYEPPLPVFYPGYGGPFLWCPGYRYGPYYYPPYAYGPYPLGSYGWTEGGNVQTLKAVAIKYSADQAGKPEQ
ncbi:MAG TPA: hypothetical protein VLV32_08815 [Burkholderiales bacterium]|nr:hypothetical protein [Burkholderiales bacterium]